jgi:carbon-monoxide dehydrogenase medium subunit
VKAAAFELARPESVAEASRLLAQPGAVAMAGGQSLGPMLNLRLAQPSLIVQLGAVPDLCGVAQDADAITLGALVTHSAIADGLVPDPGLNVLARVADGIAYRPVRNRGTIGGSLCHADPAADWVTVLMALGASVHTSGARSVAVADFVTGPFRTGLRAGEIVTAVRVPRLRTGARWGYAKACRKPGEFAHAMAAVLIDAEGMRLVIGAIGGKPILLREESALPDALAASGLDPITAHIQSVIARRALAQARA